MPLRRTSIFLTLLLACAAGSPGSPAAQADDDPIQTLRMLLRSSEAPSAGEEAWRVQLKRLIDVVAEERDKQKTLGGSVSFGFNGDEAGEESLFKLNTAVNLSVGTYPRQIRFNAGTDIQFRNDNLEEDVTRMLVNYDYYLRRDLEIFGFVERFSDNFLDIDERYEIGGGIKYEYDFPGLTGKGKAKLGAYDALDEAKEKLGSLQSPANYPAPLEALDAFAALAEGPVKTSLVKSHTKLQVGLSVSAFAELEQAETLQVFLDPVGGPPATEPTEFSRDSEQRFRLTVRPSFTYRPSDRIRLRGMFFYKLPLDSPTRVETTGERDIRADALFSAEFSVADSEKARIFVGYEWHSDAGPPGLTAAEIAAQNAAGFDVRNPSAERIHRIYRLGLKVDW